MSIVIATYWLTVFHFASRDVGTFTRTPYARSALASLSGADDHLVNVRQVHWHDRRRVEHQAGGNVRPPAPGRQVAGPGRVLAQPPHVLAVAAAELQRLTRDRTHFGRRLLPLEAIHEQARAGVVLERDRSALARAHERHVAPAPDPPPRPGAEIHEPGDSDGGATAGGRERLGAGVPGHDQRLAAHPLDGEVER